MESEKSIGAVIIHKNKKLEYLLLYRKAHAHYKEAWDLVKGLVEKGETEKETILREIREETGINNVVILPGFKEHISYFYKKDDNLVKKGVIFYLAEVSKKKVKVSGEHHGYKWLGHDEALKLLTFKNTKKVLKKANTFIKR